MEAVVSSFMDQFKTSRVKATTIETVLAAVVGIVVCLGYNIWYFEVNLGSVKGGQILDLLDYVSNNVLMPISAIGTCLLIGWIVKPKTVIDEVEKNGEKMGRKILYKVMIKFIAPILLIIILLKSFNIDVIDLVEKLF
jgi:NSS family neurotransmitter:Na+ symporter